MSAEIESLETAIVELLDGINYLRKATSKTPLRPGQVRGVSDVTTFLNMTALPTPTAIVVFNGEEAGGAPNAVVGGAHQESVLQWSVFLASSSFSSEGEGRLGTLGVYQMVDDLIEVLEGAVVSDGVQDSKLFYTGCRRFDIDETAVTYEVTLRNQWTRSKA